MAILEVKNVEESIIRNLDDLFEKRDIDDIIVAEKTEDYQIIVSNPMVWIPELEIYAGNAVCCTKDLYGDYVPDWDGTALFTKNEEGLHYIYIEQDSIFATLQNQFHRSDTLDLKCLVFDGVNTIVPHFEYNNEIENVTELELVI